MTLSGAGHWLQLLWIFAVGVVLLVAPHKKQVTVGGKTEYRWHWFWVIVIILPYIIWAGYRDNYFGDTGYYRWYIYYQAPHLGQEWIPFVLGAEKDKGFMLLTVVLRTVFGYWSEGYFLFIAAFQLICIAIVYRRYSCNFWLSMFLFVATTDYMAWMHNGIRQFTAVAMTFMATPLILKKKYIPTIIIILLASRIHGSALLMLPIIFIAQGKAWNRKTVMLMLVSVLMLAAVSQFTNLLDGMLGDTQYKNVVSDWQELQDDGTSPIRVLVYSVPAILSLMGLNHIRRVNDPVINLATNMTAISTAIWIVSMFTSGVFIGRLPVYMYLYGMGILLPWELYNFIRKPSMKLAMMSVIAVYALFFFFQMHFSWGLM